MQVALSTVNCVVRVSLLRRKEVSHAKTVPRVMLSQQRVKPHVRNVQIARWPFVRVWLSVQHVTSFLPTTLIEQRAFVMLETTTTNLVQIMGMKTLQTHLSALPALMEWTVEPKGPPGLTSKLALVGGETRQPERNFIDASESSTASLAHMGTTSVRRTVPISWVPCAGSVSTVIARI